MKYLIMCEGPNEREIINILLENDMLKFTENDLLGLTPYHARQISSSGQVKTELNIYPGEVAVYRIGDSQNEALRIPIEYKDKIKLVRKYCTKPESEMLLIIAEDLVSDFEKVKSNTKPKTNDSDKSYYPNHSNKTSNHSVNFIAPVTNVCVQKVFPIKIIKHAFFGFVFSNKYYLLI